MAIVPDDSGIEIEAMIQNQDIGFVAEGQEAVIKLDAFPFTRYGTVPGKIKIVSEDAVGGSVSGNSMAADVQDGPGEKSSNQLLYAARVTLDDTTMNIDGKNVQLNPGMAATVEIRTGKRKMIEFLLSPLMRVSGEAGKGTVKRSMRVQAQACYLIFAAVLNGGAGLRARMFGADV
jgi:hemolysin D